MQKVTIIVPAYNEEEVLPDFYIEIKKVEGTLSDYLFEYIFINDGSSDGTLMELKKLADKDPSVKYISFSRNFGKEAAIFAGLKNSGGDYTILMDADLQHPPRMIPEMLHYVAEEGFGAAGAKRKAKLSSRFFAGLLSKVGSVKMQKGATDFMCMNRAFVDAVLKMSETQRFSKGLFAWVGFRIKWLDYEEKPRTKGKSKWNFGKLFLYAADGITSFSVVPLRLVTLAGAIIFILAVIYIIITIIQTLIFGIDVPGYVTTLVVILFMGGIIMLAIGVLGEYIGHIYMETKNRPLYIMEESNLKNDEGKDQN